MTEKIKRFLCSNKAKDFTYKTSTTPGFIRWDTRASHPRFFVDSSLAKLTLQLTNPKNLPPYDVKREEIYLNQITLDSLFILHKQRQKSKSFQKFEA